MLILLLLLFVPFNQEQFDNHINNDRVVIVKFIEDDIPNLNRPIVRMLIRQNDVIKMQGKGLKVHGEPFLGIFTKDTQVLFYGKYKR